ncbi:MAG: GTP-binding protein [Candidatus Thorarchaeota archaeon]
MSKPTYIFKVPVAGDGAVGKTSLIVRYTQGTFTDTYKMTIGTSFAVKTVDLETVMVKLQIWDLAGQPHFGGVRPLFYQGSTGVIYVFSVADRASFDHLSGWLEEARKNSGNVPGILIGNKSDLIDQRVVSREEAEAFADQAGLLYIETSAKMDENVGDAFKQVAITIIQTKWPDWGKKVEEPVSAAPEEPTPPIQAPLKAEAGEPIGEPLVEPIPEPIPIPGSVETSAEESSPDLEEVPEPIDMEAIEPIEPPIISEPSKITEPEETPKLEVATSTETSSIPPTTEPREHEDIVIEHKAESSLVEFIGVNIEALSKEDFEKRSVHAMQRLGVSDVGVLGTFLRSLIRQGQRDVVIESLESLQEEQ